MSIRCPTLGELRAQTYVALDAGYIAQAEFDQLFDLVDKCSRQISRFMTYLQRSNVKTSERSNDETTKEKGVGTPERSNVQTFQRANDV